MRELVQLLKQEVDSHDRDLIAIRKVNALERAVTLGKRIDSLVRQVTDPYEANTTKFRQTRQLKDGHVGQKRTVRKIDIAQASATSSERLDGTVGDIHSMTEVEIVKMSPEKTHTFHCSISE